MLNYTTTTIVNDGANIQSAASVSGSAAWFRVNYGPKLFKDANHTPCLVAKTAGVAAQLAKAEVDVTACTSGIFRIALYIRLRNNNNPYFSNDWTFKGKPLFIEFNGGSTPAEIAALAKKYMLAQYGYDLVKFSAAAATAAVYYDAADAEVVAGTKTTSDVKTPAANAKLVITAADQWEMFMDQDNGKGVVLEELKVVDTAGQVATSSTTTPTHEEFLPVSDQSVVSVDNGHEAFGDFAHIVKDLRLPSQENTLWYGAAQGDIMGGEPNDDKPNPGVLYTQYTIQYDAERGLGQQTVLAGVGKSRTVHVFYVANGDTVSKMDTALGNIGCGSVGTANLI